jgi:sulfoxide reductase heme-binding subunit YedZ
MRLAKPGLALLAGLAAAIPAGAAVAAQANGALPSSGSMVWFAARAAGIVAYVLATLSVVVGLGSSTHTGNRTLGKANVVDVHRSLSLLTLLMIGGHVLLLAFDRYANFSAVELLVPFQSWYRPAWTGIGILAAYLAIAVYFSFYVRSHIGYSVWRAFHYAAFAVFALATFHGLLAGTDSGAVWARALYGGATGLVATMLVYRLLRGNKPRPIWAWEEAAGNLGVGRTMFAVAALCVALVLPVWVTTHVRTTSSVPSSATASAAAVTPQDGAQGNVGQQAESDDGEGGGEANEGSASLDTLTFTGTGQGGFWSLYSNADPSISLNLTPSNIAVGDRQTGAIFFQSGDGFAASGGSGQLHALMPGQGRYQGYALGLDGSYRIDGSQISVVGRLTAFVTER